MEHLASSANRRDRWARASLIGGVLGLGAAQMATLLRAGLHWDQELALFPWLLPQGWVLYRDLKDHHAPLLPMLLALLPDPGGIPGQLAVTGILLMLALVLAAATASRLRGPGAGLLAGLLVACWFSIFGSDRLWYDLALAPCYAGALLLGLAAWRAPQPARQLALLGLLLGGAVLIKQQAGIALLAGLALVPPRGPRPALTYLGLAALPILASLAGFTLLGALGDYLYWVVGYNLTSTYIQEGAAPVPPGEWPLLLGLYLPLAALAPGRVGRRIRWRPSLYYAGLLLAATIPAWPRYARFHLAAAVPLLAVGLAVAAADLVRRARATKPRAWLQAGGGLLLLGLALLPTRESLRADRITWANPSAPPAWSTTILPLRAWIAAQTRPGESILVYDLDSTLYRVLDRVPTRPWTPVFPWILEGEGVAAGWRAGLEAAQPRVVLVPSEFPTGLPYPVADGGLSDAWLRAHYRPGPTFKVQKYPDSSPQEILGLVPR